MGDRFKLIEAEDEIVKLRKYVDDYTKMSEALTIQLNEMRKRAAKAMSLEDENEILERKLKIAEASNISIRNSAQAEKEHMEKMLGVALKKANFKYTTEFGVEKLVVVTRGDIEREVLNPPKIAQTFPSKMIIAEKPAQKKLPAEIIFKAFSFITKVQLQIIRKKNEEVKQLKTDTTKGRKLGVDLFEKWTQSDPKQSIEQETQTAEILVQEQSQQTDLLPTVEELKAAAEPKDPEHKKDEDSDEQPVQIIPDKRRKLRRLSHYDYYLLRKSKLKKRSLKKAERKEDIKEMIDAAIESLKKENEEVSQKLKSEISSHSEKINDSIESLKKENEKVSEKLKSEISWHSKRMEAVEKHLSQNTKVCEKIIGDNNVLKVDVSNFTQNLNYLKDQMRPKTAKLEDEWVNTFDINQKVEYIQTIEKKLNAEYHPIWREGKRILEEEVKKITAVRNQIYEIKDSCAKIRDNFLSRKMTSGQASVRPIIAPNSPIFEVVNPVQPKSEIYTLWDKALKDSVYRCYLEEWSSKPYLHPKEFRPFCNDMNTDEWGFQYNVNWRALLAAKKLKS